MVKLSRFRTIALLTLLFFLHSVLSPYIVMAYDQPGDGWGAGGSQVGGTTNTSDQPQNPETPNEDPNNQPGCGDPVLLNTGEETYACVDLVLPGRGLDVKITHNYHSGRNYNLQFGYGWMINYYYRLQILDNGNAMIFGGDGRKDEYAFNAVTSQYTAPAGLFETLSFDTGTATWTLAKPHGEKWIFNSNGNLSTIKDRNNNQITFTYDPGGPMFINGISPYSQVPLAFVVV